jgi:dethiobiotin synthetase
LPGFNGMRAIFVAGTDTGIGKTVICGCLARYILEKGYSVITQKWIQTGCSSRDSSDIKLHFKIMCRNPNYPYLISKTHKNHILPYIFKYPASAHLASKFENVRVNKNKIIKSFKILSRKFDFVIVEGIGGVLVPFNEKQFVIDIVKELGLPVLLVVGNRLGAINQALLSIEALILREIEILGLIFNNFKKEDRTILEDNPRIIKVLSKQRIFGVLPYGSSYQRLYETFIPIGERIFKLYG